MTIEIEYWASLTKEQHDDLIIRLKNEGEYLGTDDKNVFFFIMPDQSVKIADNIAKKSAKITWKGSGVGIGNSFEEIEIPIAQNDVQKAVNLFGKLSLGHLEESFQTREDFVFNGVTISIKHSQSWGHHAELEIQVNDIAEKNMAESKIRNIAKALDITILSQDQIHVLKNRAKQMDTKSHA